MSMLAGWKLLSLKLIYSLGSHALRVIGPIKYICPITSKQNCECDIILADMPHVSTDTSMLTGWRLEAVGSSINMYRLRSKTSRASDK
jgi:hypothetical protein